MLNSHGDSSQPPLKGKQTPAYKTLEEWALKTIANHPQLQNPANAVAVGEPRLKGDSAKTDAPVTIQVSASSTKTSDTVFASQPREGAKEEKPAATPKPVERVDAFDPAIFNRQMHPEQKAPSTKQ